MVRNIVKGALIGGVVVFLWSAFSWMGLPWHDATMNSFKNKTDMTQVIKRNAPESGVYVSIPDQQAKGVQPFVFMAVKYTQNGAMGPWHIVAALCTQIVGAALLSLLISMSMLRRYVSKVIFSTIYGFAIGFLAYMPLITWMGFPFNYAAVDIIDFTVSWFIGGLVIAAVVKGCHCCKKTEQQK